MEWQNMRYSQEFKDNVVARLLSKEDVMFFVSRR